MSRLTTAGRIVLLAGTALLATTVIAAASGPVVVELFTSQGCSSCPPANANLAALSGRPGILALSFGVTYWDQLGWKDTFARPEYTARQEAYEPHLGHDGPFTPQIVVDGNGDVVGNALSEIQSLITRQRGSSGPELSLSSGTVSIGAATRNVAAADVWLVRYDPSVVEVAVARGENGGRTLPHKNVVHQLVRLGRWSGRAASFALPPGGSLRSAVLLQAAGGGRILAAATD